MELSEHPYLESRADALVAVAQAVGTGAGAHDWARVDLGFVFSDETVVHSEANRALRRVSFGESLRNVSVFLPLLVTWVGIATATLAYGRLVRDEPAAARLPFIQLWEQRFTFDGGAGAKAWWVPSFSTIGFIDAAAIFAVLALSIWVARARHRLDVTIPAEEAEVANQLASTIGDAAVILARRSSASPTTFNETMNDVAKRMSQVNTRLTSTARAAEDALTRGSEVLGQIDVAARKLADASASIATGLQAIEPVLQGTRADLQQVASAERGLAQEVTAGLSSFSAASGELASSSRALSDASSTIDRSFASGSAAAQGMQAAAAATSADLASAARELQELRSLITPLEGVMSQLSETAKAVPSAAGDLGGSAAKLDASAGRLSQATTDLAEVPTLLRDAVVQLQATLEAQRTVLEHLGALDLGRRRRWPFGRRRASRSGS